MPDLWQEAVARAAEPEELARRSLPDLDSTAMSNAVRITVAAAAVLTVALIGINLLFTGGGNRVGGPTVAPSSVPSATPSPTPTPLEPSTIEAGFIGLPPQGATASSPEDGVLVDSYLVGGGALPYRGTVRLYNDGRLIWSYFFSGPGGPNGHSTGLLEQRLTPEGVELLRTHDTSTIESRLEMDPLNLPGWLPASAWEDQTIRAYVPSRYAVCLAPLRGGEFPLPEPPMDRSQTVGQLPAQAADLFSGKDAVPPLDDGWDCLAFTTEDARQLDEALGAAGVEQSAWRNRYVLQYQVDGPGPDDGVNIYFEPMFPDDTHGCSDCG